MTNAEKFFYESIHTSPNAQITPLETPFKSNFYKSTANDEVMYMTYNVKCSNFNNILAYKVEGNDPEKAITKLHENISAMDFDAFRRARRNGGNRAIAITWGGIYVVYEPDEDTTTAYAVVQLGTLRHTDKWGNDHEDVISVC